MQNIAMIFVLITCLALLVFLLYFSFKLLRDSQKKVDAEKAKMRLDRSKARAESKK